MNIQTESSGESSPLEKKFQRFGTECIDAYPKLNQLSSLPDDIWQKMADQRLFGIGIGTEFNGHGGSSRSLVNAGKTLVEHGGNLGIALSWMIHEMVARWFFLSFGTDAQKKTYLPLLAAGEKTACLAVSEPKVGAHPKHIKTSGEKFSKGFRLNGEKTYLTNGPIADLFIVIAVTGQQSGKKQFTAFIVPKDSPGLKVTDPIDFPFLRPCPHGGILLKDCMVKPEQVLGNPGEAYDKMVLPFRTIEDTMMMGPLTGGLKFLFSRLMHQLNQKDIIPDDLLITETAQLKCTLDALAAISAAAAIELDENIGGEMLLSLGLFFRTQTIGFLKKIEQMIEKTGIEPENRLTYMLSDLFAMIRIAENVSKIKLAKLGLSLFANHLKT